MHHIMKKFISVNPQFRGVEKLKLSPYPRTWLKQTLDSMLGDNKTSILLLFHPISPTPLPRMDRVVKSLVSSKSNKNQFLTDFRLQKEKDNPTLGKNTLFKWQYSILSTSRGIELFLYYTIKIFKIGWWRQKEFKIF